MLNTRRLGSLAWLTLPLVFGLTSPAPAQRSFDDDRYRGGFEDRDDRSDGRERNVAGEFDYYALVMSWSPTYCSEKEGGDYDQQCDRQDGRRYSFVLHGLWPQYERGYPERCRTRKKPFVPQTVIDGMLDIMPSPRLVIHEFKKHGTCSGLEPDAFFDLSRKLFTSVKIPAAYQLPLAEVRTSVEEVEGQFLRANPALTPDMISISCGRRDRLKEIRICFSKAGTPVACGTNEDQARLCRREEVSLPPVRAGAKRSGSSNGI